MHANHLLQGEMEESPVFGHELHAQLLGLRPKADAVT